MIRTALTENGEVATKFSAWEWVSTARQGASGLWLETRGKTIGAFATSKGSEVLARFTDVGSGKNLNRPQLVASVQLASLTGAIRVIIRPDACFATQPFC